MKKYTRHDILTRDLTRAVRKMVHVMELNGFDPEGVIYIDINSPKLVDDSVESVISVTCALSEMQDLFEEEEIRITKKVFDKNGKQLPGVKQLIYGKNKVNEML